MDVATALAILFFCFLLLSSAAITFLLLRHFLSGIRSHRAATADDDDAEAAGAGARQLPPPCSPPQQELPLLRPAKEEPLLSVGGEKEGEPRKLTWREVEALTGGFDEAAVVGRGGSSTVYLAMPCRLEAAPPVAVKVHRWCGGERWLRAFRQELDLLRRLRHPHIVSLLAYSDDHDAKWRFKILGTLQSPPLPWRHRMRVVHDVAGVLEHLHDGRPGGAPPVVHGDVSASNVLLDGRGLDARLCDLGSACEGFSAAVAPTRAAVGSPGYIDPFFLRTGIVSKKSDVYSFGVLLLETITGSPAAGTPGPDGAGGGNLTTRLLPRVRTEEVDGLVDRRLGDEYEVAEAGDVARITVECLAAQPGLRPTMAQVRAAIAEKAARSISIAHHELHGSDST